MEAGHQHMVSGSWDHARRCFEEVLTRRPSHVGALRGLEQLQRRGHSSTPPEPVSEEIKIGTDSETRRLILRLVRAKRYEEALQALHRARRESPNDPAVARSIRYIQTHLEQRYLGLLDLHAVPTLLRQPIEGDLSVVAQWVDGASTYAEIVAQSNIGKLRTLRALHRMNEDKAIGVITERTPVPAAPQLALSTIEPPAIEHPSSPLPSTAAPLPPRSRALPFVALVVLGTLVAATGWLLADRAERTAEPITRTADEQPALPGAPDVSTHVAQPEPSIRLEVEPSIRLEIETQPSGAQVFLDERNVGETPLTLELEGDAAEARRATFRFERNGYRSTTLERDLHTGSISIAAALQRRRRARRRTEPSSVRTGALRGYKAEPY